MMIENLEKVEKNEKVFFKVKAGGKSFTAFDSSEAFNQLANKEFKVNDEVTLDFTTTPGTFNNKPIEYRNLVKITLVKSGVAGSGVTPSASVEVDWDGKERRVIRMNALRHAIGYFDINKERMKDEFPGIIPDAAVVNIARKFEEYVYSEVKKEVHGGPAGGVDDGEE